LREKKKTKKKGTQIIHVSSSHSIRVFYRIRNGRVQKQDKNLDLPFDLEVSREMFEKEVKALVESILARYSADELNKFSSPMKMKRRRSTSTENDPLQSPKKKLNLSTPPKKIKGKSPAFKHGGKRFSAGRPTSKVRITWKNKLFSKKKKKKKG